MNEGEKPKKHGSDGTKTSESVESLAGSVRTIKNLLLTYFRLTIVFIILGFMVSFGIK